MQQILHARRVPNWPLATAFKATRQSVRGLFAQPLSGGGQAALPGSTAWAMALLLVLAFALRAATIPIVSLHHPDELWQYLEPAHHIVFDRWVTTWEYREGIRSWLLPVLLSGPMALGELLAPGTGLYLLLPKIALVLGSLVIVGYAAAFGFRLSRLHGLIAGFVATTWVELVHFGPKALSEPVSLALFLPAAFLLTAAADRQTFRTRLVAGLLLGLCFSVRFQLAPALGVLVLCACWKNPREALPPLVLGGLAALAVGGAADAAMGQTPLLWMIANFRINFVENRSAFYGVAPPGWYLGLLTAYWQVALVPIVALAAIGARRYPVLLAVAAVNIAAHSLVPHKEYRFILLSTILIVLLAAIGTGDVVRWLARRASGSVHKRAAIACAAWAGISLTIGLSGHYRELWKANSQVPQALQIASSAPGACSLALHDLEVPLAAAYTYYHRDTPIYVFSGADARARALAGASSFDLVISYRGAARELDPRYRPLQCVPGLQGAPAMCLYKRAGGCTGPRLRDDEINNVLARVGH